jgi:hypothetical protein
MKRVLTGLKEAAGLVSGGALVTFGNRFWFPVNFHLIIR